MKKGLENSTMLLNGDESKITKEAVIRLLDRAEKERNSAFKKGDYDLGCNLSDKIDIISKILFKLLR